MIHVLDEGLEGLLRAAVPLPRDSADVSFDVPDRSWGARVNRMTVNLFLFDVARADLPALPAQERITDDGRTERRGPLPNVRLSYLVTAWASDTRDEHHLLGEVLACLFAHGTLPAEHLPVALPGPVALRLADRDGRRPGDLWSAIDGRLRPGFELEAVAPLETVPWVPAGTEVTAVEGRVGRGIVPRHVVEPPAPVGGERTTIRRRAGASVVTEGRRRPAET